MTGISNPRLRRALLLFGIVNATLYSALLPLWEGFDEPFHYAYVETLWRTRRLPILGHTMAPRDVFESLRLAPVSEGVYIRIRQGIPEAIPFSVWFAQSEAEKKQRRLALAALRPDPLDSAGPNYEALQAPLAYVLLAPLDWSMSGLPLNARVLVLRLFVSISSTVLLFFGASRLCGELNLPEPFPIAVLFTIFNSEMLYATIAHVANDWLAVSISVWVFAAWAAFLRNPNLRNALTASAWLATGLITKAYFLAFALWAAAIVVVALWRHRTRLYTALAGAVLVFVTAGPWYARNLVMYRNVSGTLQEFHGVGIRQTLAVAPQMNWPAVAGFLARGSIWTGNGTSNSYSRTTLNTMLALLTLAILAWIYHRSAIQSAERVIFAGIVLFSVALAYASCASFAESHGEYSAAGPWYSQVLLAPVLALAYLGMSRWNKIGWILAICTVALWSWVLFATWTIKLFPMYSGAGSDPMHPRDVWRWYAHGAASHASALSLTALAPAAILYCGMFASITFCFAIGSIIVRCLAWSIKNSPRQSQ
jgi:hypothetical protein